MRKVAKIILFRDDSFLFPVKVAPQCPVKHGKMELLGGGVENGETPLEGLVRELTEEEQSALVARNVARLQLTLVEIVVEGDKHFIYYMPISAKDLQGIRISSEENDGYRLISRSTIMAAKRLDRHIKRSADYDEYVDLLWDVEHGSLERFHLWLNDKGITDHQDEFAIFAQLFLSFIYDYEHTETVTLNSGQGRDFEFMVDIFLAKLQLSRWHILWLPRLSGFSTNSYMKRDI